MKTGSLLGHVGIGGSHDLSATEELFRDFRRGAITITQYETMTALWVASNTSRYIPKQPPVAPKFAQEYVNSRLLGGGPYHYESAKILGEWFHVVSQFLDCNSSDVRLLKWCLEKMESTSDKSSREKLNRALAIFSLVPIDAKFLEQCIKVKSMDAFDRERAR